MKQLIARVAWLTEMAEARSDSGNAVGLQGRSGSPFTWVQLSFSLNLYTRPPPPAAISS